MSIEVIQAGGETEELFIADGPNLADPAVAEAFRNQFRMTRMQVYDWGTFSGVCDIPISPRGYLILGPSGAGKSTILDAISVLLVPPRLLDFNAAAREADKKRADRNLLSYVRGAWGEKSDREAGGTAIQYLRAGTTWSAVGITYESEAGRAVTLIQLFHVRGNSNVNGDVKRHFMIFERRVDLGELEVFGQTNFDVRKLKQSFPEAFVHDEFRAYSERFSQLLGIESESALKLLHKTQSAKALGDLDAFLREYMLDRPDTFDAATSLVAEFGALNAAHQSVVTAREQVEILRPARAAYETWQDLTTMSAWLEGLRAAAPRYREHVELLLSIQVRDRLTLELAGLDGELASQKAALAAQEQRQAELQQEFLKAGGGAIGQWRTEISRLETERAQCGQKLAKAQRACDGLGLTLPTTAQKFAELAEQATREGLAWQEGAAGQPDQGKRDGLVQRRAGVAGVLASDTEEVQSLRRRRSNLPAHYVRLRAELAEALNISEASLPFIGELIQVKPEEEAAGWRGAIERVLGGTAMDLLVDERNYGAVVAYVNGRNLGLRLTYHRVRAEREQASPRAPSKESLIYKVDVDRASPFASWLQARLHSRFDCACVESLADFKMRDYAVTKEGQIRNKQRHEKDDRFSVGDQSKWVLGFDNARKVALYEDRIADHKRQLKDIDDAISVVDRKQQQAVARVAHWSTLATVGWDDIDVASRTGRIADLEGLVQEAESGNGALGDLNRRLAEQAELVRAANKAVAGTDARRTGTTQQVDNLTRKIDELEETVDLSGVSEAQRMSLSERYDELGDALTLANLSALTSKLETSLALELRDVDRKRGAVAATVLDGFKDFRAKWPMESAELGLDIEGADGYFAKLTRLEADDLPRHEARFFELLRKQSSQGLTLLLKRITYAQSSIQDRMRRVNASLARAEFNVGTYLQIAPKERNLKDVVEFKVSLQQAMVPLGSEEDAATAEARFVAMRDLVSKLGSQDPKLQAWRETVLDVRQHFEFLGHEFYLGTQDEKEVYRGSSGKSGGQKQKLTTTCLAAALRYQLGGDNAHGIPSFAPVVMDEAFDKADNVFTRLAMNIFTNFGFQMVVATPLKSVMTLERFIGGAAFVSIHDSKQSGATLIEYDDERQRLDLPERAKKAIQAAEREAAHEVA